MPTSDTKVAHAASSIHDCLLQRLWRVPSFTGKAKPGSSALAKLGISPEQVPQILDLPLLRNLAPLTQVASSQLLAQTDRSGNDSPQVRPVPHESRQIDGCRAS